MLKLQHISKIYRATEVETAALDLVKASNPHDEVFIVNFNDEAYLDVEFTNDMKAVSDYDIQHLFSAFVVAELLF